MAKHESGSFSWNETDPSESPSKEGLPTEVADSLPTVRMTRSSESAETHIDLPRGRAIDPFSATLDDAGAARLELDQTLPPIRAPSARLVAPTIPEKPSPLPAPAPVPAPPVLVPAESAPTEPELEAPPVSARQRRGTGWTLVLVAAALLLGLGLWLVFSYASSEDAILAEPPAASR